MALSGQKLLGCPSAEFPALRECHRLNSYGEAERRGWGKAAAATVPLEGAVRWPKIPWCLQPDPVGGA